MTGTKNSRIASTICKMHGAVNYVTQEGLMCGECNKPVEDLQSTGKGNDKVTILDQHSQKPIVSEVVPSPSTSTLHLADTKCKDGHLWKEAAMGGKLYCITCKIWRRENPY